MDKFVVLSSSWMENYLPHFHSRPEENEGVIVVLWGFRMCLSDVYRHYRPIVSLRKRRARSLPIAVPPFSISASHANI